jgi:hypothetical protein
LFIPQFSGSVSVLAVDCTIYDRWGNQVFHTDVDPVQWDGMSRNKLMQPAVFAYILHLRYVVDGVEHERTFAGEVTLIR